MKQCNVIGLISADIWVYFYATTSNRRTNASHAHKKVCIV